MAVVFNEDSCVGTARGLDSGGLLPGDVGGIQPCEIC